MRFAFLGCLPLAAATASFIRPEPEQSEIDACKAIAKNGYYPLYTTKACAGDSHTHPFGSVDYYMPNGLNNYPAVGPQTQWHGNYPQPGPKIDQFDYAYMVDFGNTTYKFEQTEGKTVYKVKAESNYHPSFDFMGTSYRKITVTDQGNNNFRIDLGARPGAKYMIFEITSSAYGAFDAFTIICTADAICEISRMYSTQNFIDEFSLARSPKIAPFIIDIGVNNVYQISNLQIRNIYDKDERPNACQDNVGGGGHKGVIANGQCQNGLCEYHCWFTVAYFFSAKDCDDKKDIQGKGELQAFECINSMTVKQLQLQDTSPLCAAKINLQVNSNSMGYLQFDCNEDGKLSREEIRHALLQNQF